MYNTYMGIKTWTVEQLRQAVTESATIAVEEIGGMVAKVENKHMGRQMQAVITSI